MKTEHPKTTTNHQPAVAPFETAADLAMRATHVLASMGRAAGVTALEREGAQLGQEPFKIAVVGAFKTGKSTLINAAFLGTEVLFADPLEATCVPTELAWGERPLLKIFPYMEELQPTVDSDGTISVRIGEEPAVEVSAPTPNDIRTETSAATPAEREFKAKRISRVRLETPLESLKGITILDSPGIDSTSGAVVDAALRIVPRCDAVIFVTRGGQLSQAEEDFLKSGVLDQGITRALVVVNHFDNVNPLNAEGRKKHVEALKEKLKNMGRGHLPIVSVDAREWLKALETRQPWADDAVAFQKELQRFLRNDLANARLEKAVQVIRREIRAGMVELSATAAVEQKSQQEREKLAAELDRKSTEASSRLDLLGEDFMNEFRNHLRTFRTAVNRGVSETVENFKDRLRVTSDLDGLQNELGAIQRRLRPAIESRCLDATQTLRKDLRTAERHFDREARKAISQIDAQELIPKIGADVALPPIPSPLLTVLDYIMVIFASPLPGIVDIILRLFADRFPEIRRLMPSGLVKNIAQSWIEKQLDRQVAASATEIENKLTDIEQQTDAAVRKGTAKLVESEVEPLRQALRKTEDRKARWSSSEIAHFNEALTTIHNEATTVCR